MSPKFYRNIQNTFCLRNILQYPLYSAVSLIRRTSSVCSVVSASCLRSTCPRILRCPHPHSPHGPGSMPWAGCAAAGSGEELYTLFSSATDCARMPGSAAAVCVCFPTVQCPAQMKRPRSAMVLVLGHCRRGAGLQWRSDQGRRGQTNRMHCWGWGWLAGGWQLRDQNIASVHRAA